MDLESTETRELKRFTPETTKRIYDVILNEKYKKELQSKKAKKSFYDIFLLKNKTIENDSNARDKKPEKRLEAGKILPKIYRKSIRRELEIGRAHV